MNRYQTDTCSYLKNNYKGQLKTKEMAKLNKIYGEESARKNKPSPLVASAAIRSKVIVLLLCSLYIIAPIVCEVYVQGHWFVVHHLVSYLCFAVVRAGWVVALLLLSSECYVAVIFSCLFLAMPWFGLQCVIWHFQVIVTYLLRLHVYFDIVYWTF